MATPAVSNSASPFSVLSSGSAGTSSTKAADSTASADRFLTMLVTQLQNQDPLNPMDNAQITSQMAQINAVTGLDKVNESIKSLNAQLLQAQAWQGASLVGHEVLVDGRTLAVQDGVGRAAIELPTAASSVTVEVLDSSRRVVGKVDLGAQDAGRSDFTFALGQLDPEATYEYRVSAKNSAGSVAARTLAYDRVQSVSTSGDALTLSLARGGQMPVGQVLAFN
ncbi:MAG: flagellar hook capping FlgD N-terminal domain-containing protein [Rubrivivax sp.]